MATTLTQGRWTWGNILTRSIVLTNLHTQRLLNQVRIQLTRTRQFTSQTTFDDSIARHHATHLILDEGLSLLGNQHILAIVCHATDEFLGNRILGNLQYRERASVGEALHEIVISDTTRDDTHLTILCIDILIILAVHCHLLQQRLLSRYDIIALTGKGRQQHPTGSLSVIVEFILLARHVNHLDDGTTMCHTCGDTHQDRQMQLLRHLESLLYHIISLLLVAWLHRRHHGKLTIETGVLLVL